MAIQQQEHADSGFAQRIVEELSSMTKRNAENAQKINNLAKTDTWCGGY
jgi:hypothetical protein